MQMNGRTLSLLYQRAHDRMRDVEGLVLDPACGSGTFLLEAVRYVAAHDESRTPVTVHGVEKNPRMLLLADLNLGHHRGLTFERACADSLRELGQPGSPLGLKPNSVDVILTNLRALWVGAALGLLELLGVAEEDQIAG